ncbi:MAG: cytochrome c peroxidase [Candidatus Promineifilaceae bacterium]
MSDSNSEPKIPWGQREVTIRGLLLFAGFLGVIFVGTLAILAYVALNQPEDAPVAEATPAPETRPEEVVDEVEYPPLSVLPPVSFPPDNPYSDEKAELGKMLYFDTRMSGDGSISCNSCHPASDGSWGIASPISFGYPGSTHWRNASTIINVAYYSKLNWDGGKTSIESQNKGAWGGAVGANVDGGMAEERLAQVPDYVTRFNDVFGTDYPLFSDAQKAVATYQRTITSQNVPFDAFLEGNQAAISEEATRGYELFTGKANCIACHNGSLISDDSFHNTGVPNHPGFENNALNQITFRYEQWAKGVTEEDYNTATHDLGLYYVTKQDNDRGKFRTPGLRDVCYTAPYMHNGYFANLEEVVAFYNDGGGDEPNKDPLLEVLNLTADEQADLVSFLESLCGDKIVADAPKLPPYEPWTGIGDN